MRDRLIELLYKWEEIDHKKPIDGYDSDKSISDCADHLLANGVIVPPCKVGDTVYHIASCKDFYHELDGNLYNSDGSFGDATGYYCPCELRNNCPFDSVEEFDCDALKNQQAIFEDTVKGIMIGECEYDNVIFLEYSLNVYFNEFGKTVFLTKEEAEKALAERSGK